MKLQRLSKIIAFVLITTFATGISAFADDIKTRMKQRLPVIIELKAQGIVGENNAGYLEFIGAKREKADVVAAENNDRKTVYTAIAKKPIPANGCRMPAANGFKKNKLATDPHGPTLTLVRPVRFRPCPKSCQCASVWVCR